MKIAVCFPPKDADARATAECIARAMALLPEQEAAVFPIGSGAMARVTTGDRFSAVPMQRQAADGSLLLISGAPVSHHGPLDGILAGVMKGDYRAAGKTLSRLEGAFAAVFWDNVNRKLLVVNDFLGFQPLYMLRAPGLFALASEMKGIANSGLIAPRPCPAGWAEFLAYGYFIGEDTSLEGVTRVPRAQMMLYDPAADTLEKQEYWNDPFHIHPARPIDPAAVLDGLRADVEGYKEHCAEGRLLLSGGWDSRALLLLLRERLPNVRALVVRHKDELNDMDGRLAERLARRLGVQYDVMEVSEDFRSTAGYLEFALMNELATHSLDLFIPQVIASVRSEMRAVWEGLMPQVYFLLRKIRQENDFAPPAEGLPRSRNMAAGATLFRKEFLGRMIEEFRASYRKERSRYPDGPAGVARFVAYNRPRNRTSPNPIQAAGNRVLAFTPGINRRNWEMMGAAVPEHDLRREEHWAPFVPLLPDMACVPICSGGNLYNAGMLDRLGSIRMRAFLRRTARSLAGADPMAHLKLVHDVVQTVEDDIPEMKPETVRMLKTSRPLKDRNHVQAAKLLFYWQVWRWMMNGGAPRARKQIAALGYDPA